MLFKKSPDKFWDLISSKYAASPIQDRAAYEAKITKLKTYLTEDSIVLDIGCATGTQCSDIANNVKQVTGIDISDKLLTIAEVRKAERKINNVKFVKTSLFDAHFQPAGFDIVMAFYVLHFFEDIDAVLKRIYDLLVPGGVFISETTCLGDKNFVLGKFLRLLGSIGLLPKINLLTTHKLEQAVKKAGFCIIEKVRFSDSNSEYTLIARR